MVEEATERKKDQTKTNEWTDDIWRELYLKCCLKCDSSNGHESNVFLLHLPAHGSNYVEVFRLTVFFSSLLANGMP